MDGYEGKNTKRIFTNDPNLIIRLIIDATEQFYDRHSSYSNSLLIFKIFHASFTALIPSIPWKMNAVIFAHHSQLSYFLALSPSHQRLYLAKVSSHFSTVRPEARNRENRVNCVWLLPP